MKKILLFLLLFAPLYVMAEEIPVAVISRNSDGTQTLTFTYAEDSTATGKDGKEGTYRIIGGGTHYARGTRLHVPMWVGNYYSDYITKAVFDRSFYNAEVPETSYWFFRLKNLRIIEGLENLNTSKVRDMQSMFRECSSLTNLNLSKFETGCVNDMKMMFYRCSNLKTLNLSSFDTKYVSSMSNMFSGCESLTSIDVSSFTMDYTIDMSYMFNSCSSLTEIDLRKCNPQKVTNMESMFMGCSNLQHLYLDNFNTGNVTNMKSMFSGCSNLINIDLSSFRTGNAITMAQMFYNCQSLTSLDISNFRTDYVTDMSYMFSDCNSLTDLDVSHFCTVYADHMEGMFRNCSSLTHIDVSSFDTSISNGFVSSMFLGCSHLTSLNLQNFTTLGWDILSGCISLETLYIGNNDCKRDTFLNDYPEDANLIFDGVGTATSPCKLIIGSQFDKSVLGDLHTGNGTPDYYIWRSGYFTLDDSATGIDDVKAKTADANVPAYNLAGQRVGKDYKGVVIVKGKKTLRK